jgi:hypothetical protein
VKIAKAYRLMEKLAQCMRDSFEDFGVPDFCKGGLYPGAEVPWDYSSDCSAGNGQWWVRMTTYAPTVAFPEIAALPVASNRFKWMLGLEIGAVRAIPGANANGTPPTDEQNTEATKLLMSDMMAMRAAIICCFGDEDIVVSPYTPLGPQGYMAGGSWLLAVDASQAA